MPRSSDRFNLATLLVVVFVMTCSVASADGWRAGVAKSVITPKQSMWMSGYASRNRPADGKIHDLWTKVLVLETADRDRAVLVTLDLIGIGKELSGEICESLLREHAIQRHQVALATSHTHSGPVVGRNLRAMYFLDESYQKQVEAYTQELIQAVVRTVGQAIANLEAVTVKQGTGQTDIAVNRRNNPSALVPGLRAEGKLKGPVDHDVPVLTVTNADGQRKAIVFGYACHATLLNFYQWSGDWPGAAQLQIEKNNPGCIALFWAGCGADQNPLPRRKIELLAKYGKQMATAVQAVVDGTEMKPVNAELSTKYREINLAFATLPTRSKLEEDTNSGNRYIASRARLLLRQWDEQGGLNQTYPYPIQVWRIGDVRFILLGGEVVVDYALRLKRELQGKQTWVAGYTNDVMAYIPSLRVLKEGGYEGASSMIYYGQPTVWADDVEERLVKAVHSMVREVTSN